jgi:thiol-disulfide isomerase/thioredoxin
MLSRMRGGKTKKASSASRTTMGRLMPPVDITNDTQLNELTKRIAAGPLTLVLVYADWCGHCQHFKPTMAELEKCPGRSIQTARVRDDMFPKSTISTAKIEGYPSLLLVKPNGDIQTFKNTSGQTTNAIPNYTDVNKMKLIVRNAGKPEGVSALNGVEVKSSVPKIGNAKNLLNSPPRNSEVGVEPESINVQVSEEALDPSLPLSGSPKTLSEDRIPTARSNSAANRIQTGTYMEAKVNALNSSLINSASKTLQDATSGKGEEVQPQAGGSLWAQLALASKELAPVAALFYGATVLQSKGTRSRKAKGLTKRKAKKSRKARKN